MAATVRLKANLSRLHLSSAKLYANLVQTIEDSEGDLNWPQPSWEESKAHSIAAVILSAAAVEASINEFFQQVVDEDLRNFKPLTTDQLKLLKQLWPEVESFSPLRKYQVVLTAMGEDPFDRGDEPFQSAEALFQLRNALVHFKPEWDDDLKTHSKLEKRLSPLFPISKLAAKAPGKMVWFPYGCFGAGCAHWATDTVCTFGNAFSRKLSIGDRFD